MEWSSRNFSVAVLIIASPNKYYTKNSRKSFPRMRTASFLGFFTSVVEVAVETYLSPYLPRFGSSNGGTRQDISEVGRDKAKDIFFACFGKYLLCGSRVM